jgi:glycosyltransferase involved in cell wall biosynthesis
MPTLRVGIDASPLVQTRAGTARYVTELTRALERRSDVQLTRFAFGGRGRATAAVRDSVWYPLGLPVRARRERVDVLHCPTFRAPPFPPTPLVVTVLDLAVLRYPQLFNRWTSRYSALTLPRIARAASAIVAISEFTKREIVDLLDVPADKVRVTPLGVGTPFGTEGPASEGDYVLAVATLEPRKNLETLVTAFGRAGLDGTELRVAGGRGWGDVQLDGGQIRYLGYVSDEELAKQYRGARCVAYVSRYEGFGLPVLEALACGAPVVASDLPPIREFADGAAVTIDPDDADAIAAGLAEAVRRGDDLAARGPQVARAYDWKRTADATVAVYREVTA